MTNAFILLFHKLRQTLGNAVRKTINREAAYALLGTPAFYDRVIDVLAHVRMSHFNVNILRM